MRGSARKIVVGAAPGGRQALSQGGQERRAGHPETRRSSAVVGRQLFRPAVKFRGLDDDNEGGGERRIAGPVSAGKPPLRGRPPGQPRSRTPARCATAASLPRGPGSRHRLHPRTLRWAAARKNSVWRAPVPSGAAN
ncbi:hypothetical protein ACPA9J_28010 [Pseudomonas aeruginosa]